MMIPVEPFNNPPVGSREYNAVAKALEVKPEVSLYRINGKLRERYYCVRGGTIYVVKVYEDPDSQFFVECNCQAGAPPLDRLTGLPSREAFPCYHAAAVLLHIAEEEKDGHD